MLATRLQSQAIPCWAEGPVADTMAGMITDWLDFWDSRHSIYVNARHKDVHYRLIAEQIAALVPGADARVLDCGSGEATHADVIAAGAGELFLCEAAPFVREALAQRFSGQAKIRVLAPHEMARLPKHSLDLVVLHSVVQYLTPAEASALFTLFHRLLKRGGMLVVSDVIPPELGAAMDAVALLRFGSANGFFLAAASGLVRTMLSRYARLRMQLGLARYAKTAMIEKLSTAGLEAQFAPHNIGHNQARRTYYARPRCAALSAE
jgi:SAM-dependent methyltransferase